MIREGQAGGHSQRLRATAHARSRAQRPRCITRRRTHGARKRRARWRGSCVSTLLGPAPPVLVPTVRCRTPRGRRIGHQQAARSVAADAIIHRPDWAGTWLVPPAPPPRRHAGHEPYRLVGHAVEQGHFARGHDGGVVCPRCQPVEQIHEKQEDIEVVAAQQTLAFEIERNAGQPVTIVVPSQCQRDSRSETRDQSSADSTPVRSACARVGGEVARWVAVTVRQGGAHPNREFQPAPPPRKRGRAGFRAADTRRARS